MVRDSSAAPVPAADHGPGRLARLVPAVDWLAHYRREWLRGDVVAALTTWALVVPQAIALILDDLTDERTSSTGLIEAWYANGGLDGVAAAFADWERWCAEVFDSHTAYPMLAFFRSRQPGQH
jgi:hypothetical protein